MEKEKPKHKWHPVRLSRDTALFALGIVIILNEALLNHGPEHPYLLFIAASLLGLPIFLRRNGQ